MPVLQAVGFPSCPTLGCHGATLLGSLSSLLSPSLLIPVGACVREHRLRVNAGSWHSPLQEGCSSLGCSLGSEVLLCVTREGHFPGTTQQCFPRCFPAPLGPGWVWGVGALSQGTPNVTELWAALGVPCLGVPHLLPSLSQGLLLCPSFSWDPFQVAVSIPALSTAE